MNSLNKFRILNSLSLKIIAMIAMLLDHLWLTVFYDTSWLTLIGRIAFPIFAFLLVEGFFHTTSLKKYLLRLTIFALISELPFNLMVNRSIFYPFHQNVLFTFIIGLLTMYVIERTKKLQSTVLAIVLIIFSCMFSFVFATIVLADYFGFGVLIILTFYFAHGQKYGYLIELFGMVYVNYILLGDSIVPIFDGKYVVQSQVFALFSLIFIWLYNGKPGKNGNLAKYSFYIFYPIHMLILYFISIYLY